MSGVLRLLFVGDVVGEGGLEAVRTMMPALRRELEPGAVVVNAENSAGGRGVTRETAGALLEQADFLTLGDHAYDKEEARGLLAEERRVVRPDNFSAESPGARWGVFEAAGGDGRRVGVLSLQGRVLMQEVPVSPFEAADAALERLAEAGAETVIVDFHAEATAEKQGMGYHLDGRVGAVIGTHTHVPTADEKILPGGTAYLSDVGMAGASEGVIGIDREGFMRMLLGGEPPGGAHREGPQELNAVLVELDELGRASSIRRIRRELER